MLTHKDWKKRNCPVCESSQISSSPVSRSSTPAEHLSYSEIKDSFVGLRSRQIFFSYYRCQSCSLLYCPWYFDNQQLAQLYREMPDNLMGEDKTTISKTQSGYVKWLGRHIVKIKSYLEIGPDIGLVAASVVNHFPVTRALLVEPNIAVHKDLRYSVSKVDSVQVVQYLSESSEKNFDLVVGVHVFDHLLNPVEELRLVALKSSNHAKLLIIVHNEKSLLRRILSKKWPPFCLQHPQLYNPSTLQNLLSKSGWHLEQKAQSINWWRLDHFIQMGLKVLGLPSGIGRMFPNFEIPMRLGNTIAIASRIDV